MQRLWHMLNQHDIIRATCLNGRDMFVIVRVRTFDQPKPEAR